MLYPQTSSGRRDGPIANLVIGPTTKTDKVCSVVALLSEDRNTVNETECIAGEKRQ